MSRTALLLALAAVSLAAQPRPAMPAPDVPDSVRDLFRAAAEAMVNQDAGEFLSRFDSKMPGYDTLRDEIESLLNLGPITSDIEFVSDKGEDQRHDLQIDWLMQIPDQRPRRQVLHCRIERQGRKWKITLLEPLEFFKPPAP